MTIVTEVARSALQGKTLAPMQAPQHLVSLSSVEDDSLGEELQVVWELEPGLHVHEELIVAGGLLREGRFRRMNVGEAERSLDAALPREPSHDMKRRLQEAWPNHADSLIKALEARGKDRTASLEKDITVRAEKEVRDLTTILGELQRLIEEKLEGPFVQLELFTDLEEKEQVLRNREALVRRVREIPGEIEREAAAIRLRHANPVPRLFPVAITYLVPEKEALSG